MNFVLLARLRSIIPSFPSVNDSSVILLMYIDSCYFIMSLDKELQVFLENIRKTDTENLLDIECAKFLGKSGKLTSAFRELAKLSPEKKKELGLNLNKIKSIAESAIAEQRTLICKTVINKKLLSEKLDITLPVVRKCGNLHILTHEIRRIKREYQSRGYLILDGPEIETEFFNFDALNIPKYHPARQLQDTFYIKNFESTLLRTQTSCVQIRALQKYKLPLRMISIGKTYRNDKLDATHSPMFHQIECLVADRNPVCIGHLKEALRQIISFVFETDTDNVSLRFRPSFFPFTEPSMEVDCCYKKVNGKIELVKDGNSWLELGGSGMVHPNVFKNCGITDQVYGFAYGFGLERLIMLKYGITDIRSLFDSDPRILSSYTVING